MAIQKGLLEFVGTLDGLNFYFDNGKRIVRKSGGGFTREAILSSPKMERVRENAAEFKNTSLVKKLLYHTLYPNFLSYKNRNLNNRLMGVLQQIKTYDTLSARGERHFWQGITQPIAQELLLSFLFTPDQSVSPLLGGLPRITTLGENCDCSRLALSKGLWPKMATTVGIRYGVVDLDKASCSKTVSLAPEVYIAFATLPTPLPNITLAGLPPLGDCRLAFLSIHFYQELNGQLYALPGATMFGLRCVGVFV